MKLFHTQNGEDSGISTGVSWALIKIRSSFLNFVVVLGIILLLLSVLLSGYVESGIDVLTNPVVAAMTFVWGISAFVYAILGHFGLKAIGYH